MRRYIKLAALFLVLATQCVNAKPPIAYSGDESRSARTHCPPSGHRTFDIPSASGGTKYKCFPDSPQCSPKCPPKQNTDAPSRSDKGDTTPFTSGNR